MDGGENWEVKYHKDLGEGRFRDIQFLDANIGFVVGGRESFGSTGVLLKTNAGGKTWQQASLSKLSTLTHISIVDKKNIWVCGFGGTLPCRFWTSISLLLMRSLLALSSGGRI